MISTHSWEEQYAPLEFLPSHSAGSLLPKSRARKQLDHQGLFQTCDRSKIRDIFTIDDPEDSAVRYAGPACNLPDTDGLAAHGGNEPSSEELGVLGRDIVREVSREPVNTFASGLRRPDGLPLSHTPTVNEVDKRPPIPHHLVGAPADRGKDSFHSLQPPKLMHYSGLYIDQDSAWEAEKVQAARPEEGIPLVDAVQAVLDHWSEHHALTDKSFQKFDELLHRYAKFAVRLGATELADQSEELAAQWIGAKGHDRSGNIVLPSASTMNTRRSALRKFFRDAETLSLSTSGLVVRTKVPPRKTGLARPLTEEEARLVWIVASDAGPHTRRPVLFALMLSGVHSSEVGLVTVKDVDVANQRVWAHGDTTRIKPRWVSIPDEYFPTVLERLAYIGGWLPPHRSLAAFQLTQGTSKQPMGYSQNRAAAACKEVFRRVGLHNRADITPSSVSLYSGALMLRNGARIEAAARTLGYASLDSCASALGFDWQSEKLTRP